MLNKSYSLTAICFTFRVYLIKCSLFLSGGSNVFPELGNFQIMVGNQLNVFCPSRWLQTCHAFNIYLNTFPFKVRMGCKVCKYLHPWYKHSHHHCIQATSMKSLMQGWEEACVGSFLRRPGHPSAALLCASLRFPLLFGFSHLQEHHVSTQGSHLWSECTVVNARIFLC